MAKMRLKTQVRDISFNVTPLIDLLTLLIVFFFLAGQFASMDNAKLDVPDPGKSSLAEDLKLKNKAVVNIPPDPLAATDQKLKGKALCWRITNIDIELGDTERLVAELTRAKANFEKQKSKDAALAGQEFQVEIRADRSVYYGQVQEVMLAAAKAGIKRMNITALVPVKGDK